MALEIPSVSITVMKVNTAPTGWVKTNTNNLNAFRVVTGSASSGGTVNYTSVLIQHTTTTSSIAGSAGGTSLTAPQLPLHTHRQFSIAATVNMQIPAPGLSVRVAPSVPAAQSGNVGSSLSHTHSATLTSGSFSGSNLDLRVKYVDCILVQRS
jgi:hypothetical protein